MYTPEQRTILQYKPGITDNASLHFRNEEQLLRSADNVEEFYVRYCLPRKLELNREYAEEAGFFQDLWIILQTVSSVVLNYSPPIRVWLLLCLYALELTSSLWMAYELRFDFEVEPELKQERLFVMLWLVPLQLLFLARFHQLTPLLGYFSTPDLARMFHALTFSAVVAGGVWWMWGVGYAPPRGVIILDFVFALVGLTGVRLFLRVSRERAVTGKRLERQCAHRVAIIGAGDTGAVLAHELSLKPGLGLDPVAFFDDEMSKWYSRVHDIPVLGPPEKLLEPKVKATVEEAIIAMPSAPPKRVGELVRLLRDVGLPCKTVPSIDQLALGQVNVSQLRRVEIQDLLGRERVDLETKSIRSALQDHVVLVTGAGGSIGTELCRQIAAYNPRHLLLVDRSEPQVFQIEQELIARGHGGRSVPLVADILDRARMEEILAQYRPQIIFHAAAHKHVPMMEHQPGEAIKNNTLGTAQLTDLALEYGVDRFVMISTDKAINPTSVMGATKRLAECYMLALHAANAERTKFMAVRFGNVLGSSGSVIPLFEKQIALGGPVKVTHPEMTRYFMTIPEASMLVLQSAAQGVGGEIFVLDMGRPVKIVDLARQMIELSGLRPDTDIQIEFCGIRPGEKLFEEISHKGENFAPTHHAKIFRFISPPMQLADLRKKLDHLRTNLHRARPHDLKLLLQDAVPEYTPYLEDSVNEGTAGGSDNRAAPAQDQRTTQPKGCPKDPLKPGQPTTGQTPELPDYGAVRPGPALP
jgi:FlaA1/EpsC-like NDP-sugar epimerase